jgi:hypothetical protein
MKDSLICALKIGSTARLAQYHGGDYPFPRKELDGLQDIDGRTVRRVTRKWVWLEMGSSKKSRVPRKYICTYVSVGHPSVPCYVCGYDPR